MPVQDWKLTISYSMDAYISMYNLTSVRYTNTLKEWYYRYKWRNMGTQVLTYTHKPYYKYGSKTYRYTPIEQYETNDQTSSTERFKYYERRVFEKPSIQSSFTGINIPCFNTDKRDPLSGGKGITLAALLWGTKPGD